MNASVSVTGARREEVKYASLSCWHRLFYLLVAFAVLTVSLSLYLSHRFMQIYVHSLAVNQAWVERLHECSQLGQLAAGVNAPGNDVFQTNKVEAESKNMNSALLLFNLRLGAFEEELRTNVEETQRRDLLGELQIVRQSMAEMTAEAQGLFAYLSNQQPQKAGESMAAMDRSYAKVIRQLEQLRGKIAAIQSQHFDKQTAAAAALQRFEYAVAALIFLLAGGALVYGHKVRRQVEAATQEKERSIKALRESETQLDRRVQERTAQLVQANEARRQAAQIRRELLKKLMSAQEDERRRIARDLHDAIGQSLTSLLVGLRTVADAIDLETARTRIEDLRHITVATIEEVGRLARGLRPSVLDDLGLVAALRRYATDFAQTHGIPVEVKAPARASERLPEEVETALYRIVQEALTNTAKHAAASHIRVGVERHSAFVQVIVEDDGCGFDLQKAATGGRLGLPGMHERATLLNGNLHIASQSGRGTTISVRIPLEDENHGEYSRVDC